MSKLIIRLDPAFFAKGALVSNATAEIDPLFATFSELQATVDALTSGQDIPPVSDDQDFEIGRGGNSYRVDKSLPKELNIANFKAYLSKKEIADEALQNLILHFLIQNKCGLQVVFGKIIGFLLRSLVEDQHLLTTISKGFQPRLEFNKAGVLIKYKTPIVESVWSNEFGIDISKKVGWAEASICIKHNKEIIFSPLEITLLNLHLCEHQALLQNLQQGLADPKKFPNVAITPVASKKPKFKRQNELAPENKIKAWFSKYKWVVASISGAIIFGAIGAALCSTGFLSPLGLLAAGLGFKLGISGAALLAANIALSAGVGVLNGALVEGAILTTQIVAAHTADILRQEEYIIKPAVKIPAISPALTKLGQNREVVSEGQLPELSDSAEEYSTASTNDEEAGLQLGVSTSKGQSPDPSDTEEERNASTEYTL